MKLPFKNPLFSLSIAATMLITIGSILQSTCSFAESKRPDRNSISFGADKKPDLKIAPQLESFKTVFADIAEKVIPTVVSVIPTKIDTIIFSNNPFYQFFGDQFSPEDFFGGPQQDPRRQRRSPPVEKREYRQQGIGSGVIVSKDGYILTNYHVVAGANEIEIKTSDKRSFQAEIVGLDSLADIAVVKIKEKIKDLPVAYLGNSDKLRPGDWAIAIGNPFSLTSTVTTGIVSALKRTAPSNNDTYQNFIQTDAAINPGNSGGALVNINGELIGINTMIYTQSGGFMGIGFAIPINMAKQIMEDLIYEGKVSRGWLGVMIQELDQTTRDAMGLDKNTKGVLIGDVFKGQPGDKAGMKRGDIVTHIASQPIEGTNELRNTVASIHPGEKVPVEIIRNGKKMELQVVLTSRDSKKIENSSFQPGEENGDNGDIASKLGLTIAPLTTQTYNQLGLDPAIKGVIITEVNPSSQAAQQGLQQNDIILEINRQQLQTVKDFKQVTQSLKEGDSILFLVLRDNNTFFKAFKIKK